MDHANKLIQIEAEAVNNLRLLKNLSDLETARIQYLGANGQLSQITRQLPELPLKKRAETGKQLNRIKKNLNQALDKAKKNLLESESQNQWIDVTAPGIKPHLGHIHPQTQTLKEIIGIFESLGYQTAEGPEIETDYYNFEALNIPKDHPARDTQMTFYLSNINQILRTQTSAMQGRVMKKTEPPLRVIVPGKCYRYEQVDASHGFEFWQLEGFYVDKNVHLTDLFGTINYLLKQLFGQGAKLRFATTNFPFVEPGVDTYLHCTKCAGRGCSFCKQTGWSEIMPAGMIHPNVLRMAGIDAKEWNGFAFAIGLDRVVILKHQITDLRTLTNPDMRILTQF